MSGNNKVPSEVIEDVAGRVALCMYDYGASKDLESVDSEIDLIPEAYLEEALTEILQNSETHINFDRRLFASKEALAFIVNRIKARRLR